MKKEAWSRYKVVITEAGEELGCIASQALGSGVSVQALCDQHPRLTSPHKSWAGESGKLPGRRGTGPRPCEWDGIYTKWERWRKV